MFPVQKCQLYPCRNYNNNTNNTLIYKAPEALASEVLKIQPTKLSKFGILSINLNLRVNHSDWKTCLSSVLLHRQTWQLS